MPELERTAGAAAEEDSESALELASGSENECGTHWPMPKQVLVLVLDHMRSKSDSRHPGRLVAAAGFELG